MEFLTVTLPTILTVVGANYLFVRDVRRDLKDQMEKFEIRMEKIDYRWEKLFEKFHILDKDVASLRGRK